LVCQGHFQLPPHDYSSAINFYQSSQEKLRLDFDDGQAVEWMQALINESATAMMPQIMETTHRWAQYWR